MTSNKSLLLFLGLFLGLLFLEFPKTALFEPDEARYAEIPREMVATGDFVTPRQNGSVYLEKPPFLYWLNAISLKIFGENSYALRLPTRLAAFATTVLIIMAGGVWAALIYISSVLVFALSRTNIIDGLLTFAMTLCLLSMATLVSAEKNSKAKNRWVTIGVGVGAALAMLSKGLIAIVLPALILFIWCVLHKDLRPIKTILWSWAIPVFFLITTPWFLLVQKANPDFFHFFFIREHFQRFSTNIHRRQEPFWFFLLTFLWGFLPWTPFVLKTLFQKDRTWLKNPHTHFLLIWSGVIIGFFSISQSKLIPYILPMFPAAALLLADQFPYEPNKKMVRRILSVWALIFLALIIIIPKKSEEYSSVNGVLKAQSLNARVVAYKCYPESGPWALKKPMPVVEFKGELASVGPLDPTLFLKRSDFFDQWESADRICAFSSDGDAPELIENKKRPGFVVDTNGHYKLICNFPASDQKM